MPMDLPPQAVPAHEVRMVRQVGGEDRALPLFSSFSFLEINSQPPQGVPIILATESTSGPPSQPRVSKICWVVSGEKPAPGAANQFTPITKSISKVLGFDYSGPVVPTGTYQITVIDGPSHGRVWQQELANSNWIGPNWVYEAAKDGFSGRDQATFLIQMNGKQYRSVVEFQIVQATPNDAESLHQLYVGLCKSGHPLMDLRKLSDSTRIVESRHNFQKNRVTAAG